MPKKRHKATALALAEVLWSLDRSPDLSHIGTFTDDYEEGAIMNTIRDNAIGFAKWFVSANHQRFDAESWKHVDGKTKRDLIRKHGSLRNAERSYAHADYDRMTAYNCGDWHMTFCKVRVIADGLEEAASCFGIESDCGDKYRDEVERDLVQEACSALSEKIGRKVSIRNTIRKVEM